MARLPLLVSFPNEAASVDLLAAELQWERSQVTSARKLLRRRLPPLVSTDCLPFLFGVSPRLIAAMGHQPQPTYYRIFKIAKRSGGERQIEAPRRFLKIIQRWLHDHVLSEQRVAQQAKGFVQRRSIFDHGKIHSRGTNLLAMDIKDFFPSVKSSSVRQIFEDIGFPPEVAIQLSRLCCLDDRLPQGAPTSPVLANLVFRPLDKRLAELAKKWSCKYSRYADDLAFSGDRRFKPQDINAITHILKTYGFTPNDAKSRIIGGGGQQVVAGLVVNKKSQPLRSKRRRWRAMFHRAAKHPGEYSDRAAYLVGVASFVNQYDPDLATEYRSVAEKVVAAT